MRFLNILLLILNLLSVEAFSQSNTSTKLVKTLGTSKEQNVHCGLQDKVGNLWFGTTGEGVYRYDGKYFTQFTKKDGLTNNKIWAILEDKSGIIWFGTDSGICQYDGKHIRSIPIAPIKKTSYDFLTPNSGYTTVNNAVWSIMQDKSGILWFGTDNGLYTYDGKQFSEFINEHRTLNKDGLTLKMVQCIFQDKTGTLWFGSSQGTSEGLVRYDGHSLTRYRPNGDGWIRSILEDREGNLYFACRFHGVAKFSAGKFSDFTKGMGLSDNGAGALFQDRQGNIWFAAQKGGNQQENGGLWRYDGQTFKNYRLEDGLIDNSVWLVMEDNAGSLWVGTRHMGLHKFDGKRFISYTE